MPALPSEPAPSRPRAPMNEAERKARALRKERQYGKPERRYVRPPMPETFSVLEWTRIDDSWFVPSETDKTEPYHRIDLLAGMLFCTCVRWQTAKTCKHVNRALEEID